MPSKGRLWSTVAGRLPTELDRSCVRAMSSSSEAEDDEAPHVRPDLHVTWGNACHANNGCSSMQHEQCDACQHPVMILFIYNVKVWRLAAWCSAHLGFTFHWPHVE